jgi:hypothetical protein
MDFQFEKPTAEDAPKTIVKPWTVKLEYRSGKTPEAYADQATPEKAKAGFTFYRSETQQKGYLPPFKCAMLGVYSGVSGAVPNGTRFDNYWSNFVKDTRTDTIRVQLGSGDNSVTIAEGIYNEFKHTLPTGVSYTKFAVVYLFATGEVATLELSASLELALKEVIAKETGNKPGQINLFNLFELVNRFWGFGFTGRFSMRQKDGAGWTGNGDMFFYPELTAGIVTSDMVPVLPELAQQVSDYIDATQEYFSKRQKYSAPAAATNPEPTQSPQPTRMETAKAAMAAAGFVPDPTFPTVDLTSNPEDLPF